MLHANISKNLSLLIMPLITMPALAETASKTDLPSHNMAQHSQHQSRRVSGGLTESGTDMFATIQEVIQKLSADPNTDWSKVNLEALRQHLRDMFEFSYNVDVISQQPIEQGVKIRVKPVTARAEHALDRVLGAHPVMLKMETGWDMKSNE